MNTKHTRGTLAAALAKRIEDLVDSAGAKIANAIVEQRVGKAVPKGGRPDGPVAEDLPMVPIQRRGGSQTTR